MPFEFVNQNDYILVKLSGECLGGEKPGVGDVMTQVLNDTKIKLFIFQASECSTITGAFLREMTLGYRALKAVNGQVRFVGGIPAVVHQIVSNGLDRIFICKMSLKGALIDFGLAKQKDFDVNVINPFLNATIKVLKIQCFLEAKPGKPTMKKPTDPLLLGDVSGIISVVSETFNGSFAISLSEAIFCGISKNMLGEDCPAITEKNVDLVGELANMILGQAKVELGQLGYAVQMAIPSCVWGKDHKIKHFGGGTCVVLPFETEIGTFYSEVMTSNAAINQIMKKAG